MFCVSCLCHIWRIATTIVRTHLQASWRYLIAVPRHDLAEVQLPQVPKLAQPPDRLVGGSHPPQALMSNMNDSKLSKSTAPIR